MSADGMGAGGGVIGLFARHRTAANLLMTIMIVAGLFAFQKLNTQFFPDFGIDIIQIGVDWEGASAEDVDSTIVQAIEPEVRFLDGVKRVRSISREGVGLIVIEFYPGTDMQAALADVETAVGQVTTLPEDSDRPVIKRLVRYDNITRIVLSGPFSEAALKAFGKRAREDLLARGIAKVDLVGARDEEIWAEVDEATLRRLDLTAEDIAQRIGASSRDLPAGDTRGSNQAQVRSLGLAKTARAFGRIVIRSLPNGEKILLRDIAKVSERFEDGGVTVRRAGQPAIELHVQRSLGADALAVAAKVDDYVKELRATLPPNMSVDVYNVEADLIRSRIDLLLRNGLSGLILVITILFIFLNGRVALWVAAGIPVALMATIAVMLATGQSINMVSLFGIIMALGIVVDDAIVVGEHAESLKRRGLTALDAAVSGARRMAVPVMSASLTTIAAFLPLMLISDIMGEIIRAIPLVVISIILASLVECFLVLPGHLSGALARETAREWRARVWFDRGFARFRDGPFRRWVLGCVRWRYATLATAVAMLVLAVGLILGGRVSFVFFPQPEVDWVYANIEFAAGAPRARTEAMLDELDRALGVVEARLTGGKGGLVKVSVGKVGTQVGRDLNASAGDQVGGMMVELAPTDQRQVTAAAFIDAWRDEVRPLPGLETLTIVPAQGGPPGREIDVRLSGTDLDSLKAAATEVRALLARYPGVSDIEDDMPLGKREMILRVNAHGEALGFTTTSLGRQLRHAFEGAIATRFARGDEEVTVRVELPRAAIGPGALDRLYLRGPGGDEVALSEIADRGERIGFARIKREDGVREAAVTAEIDKSVTTGNDVLAALTRDGVFDIARRHGVDVRFAGKAEEQAQTMGDIRFGAMLGLVAIYIILAWVFASYARPLVVMSVIPLGFVGATIGHLLLGYDLTILSVVALAGLSGIVVNDSIILVTTIDERLRRGEGFAAAIVDGTRDRLRAVILTSATTIGGLTPLLFETSLQAQFLIPMALTIVFGLMATTLLVLFVVPALIAVQHDFSRLIRGPEPRTLPTAITKRAAE